MFSLKLIFLAALFSAVQGFGTVLRPDDAATCSCDNGESLTGCLEGDAPAANNCAKCYIIRRKEFTIDADGIEACKDRWASQLRWMCAQGGNYAGYAAIRLTAELPGADSETRFDWSEEVFGGASSCDDIVGQFSVGRVCNEFINTHIQFDKRDDGFSGRWCGAITKELLESEGTQCDDYYLFKRNWNGHDPNFAPIDYALRCTENLGRGTPCVGAPAGGDWRQIAQYCPLAENLPSN
uniref:Lysozyme n=1 Tax=Chrysotila carterae TaxID=13221 RepID=A0A6S9THR3_CHRCT|mmetsp:Transcript_10799/g.23005  ORF Transcript_10799/g.23005 Transcript_10799/m.23005 type:complete len:238 (+) Transcript_10799:290-1003(+)|eukprot:6214752-Pleurochrysis_carterae.AAC.2